MAPRQRQNKRTSLSLARRAATHVARLVLSAALIGLPAWVAAAHAAAPSRDANAHLARMLPVTDTSRLHLINKGGEYITEKGQAAGTVPGRVLAHLEVGPTVVTKFTIYTRVPARSVAKGRAS
jgi:hypothetical protein